MESTIIAYYEHYVGNALEINADGIVVASY